VRVALLDNGFHYAEHAAFDSIRVVAQRDFVNGDEVVGDEADQPITGDEMGNSQNLHGAQVLSLLAGYHPDHFIGVAPDAEYILAKTELDDNLPELPSEEDRWVAGLEWADSLGAQVVNSSLGYNRWDDGTGYTPADLDGETALTSVAAALAVRRGIVVVVAAGNEANGDWHYITVPADADGAIAVGAVDVPGSGERVPQIASFSSRGPTADGRIKPDVVAPGSGVVVADLRRGGYVRKGGTSFAAPLVSGVCALLLQIHPQWEPAQVLEALRSTAQDLGAAGPDTVYGWGQINALAASGLSEVLPREDRLLAPFPNPARDGEVHFPVQLAERGRVELRVFDVAGRLVFAERWDLWPGSHDRPGRAPRWTPGRAVANGIYFYQLRSPNRSHLGKIALVR
jgi:subtilisin family serine protease